MIESWRPLLTVVPILQRAETYRQTHYKIVFIHLMDLLDFRITMLFAVISLFVVKTEHNGTETTDVYGREEKGYDP